jgi:hypothetical protein
VSDTESGAHYGMPGQPTEPQPQFAAAEPITVATVAEDDAPPAVTTPTTRLEQIAAEQQVAQEPPPVHGYPFQWGGREWRVKPQFDVRVPAVLQSGNLTRALGLLLGKEQAEALLAHDCEESFTDQDLANMMITASGGTPDEVTMGESSASSTS